MQSTNSAFGIRTQVLCADPLNSIIFSHSERKYANARNPGSCIQWNQTRNNGSLNYNTIIYLIIMMYCTFSVHFYIIMEKVSIKCSFHRHQIINSVPIKRQKLSAIGNLNSHQDSCIANRIA